MADKNIQIKHFNGTSWDRLYPKTKAFLVELDSGEDLESKVAELIDSIGSLSGSGVTMLDVKNEIVGLAPANLDTLKKLADALGNDPNFNTSVNLLLNDKVDKEGSKVLSTNDFTDIFKNKLESIQAISVGTVAPAGGVWFEEV